LSATSAICALMLTVIASSFDQSISRAIMPVDHGNIKSWQKWLRNECNRSVVGHFEIYAT
jgi:hypothetical protein